MIDGYHSMIKMTCLHLHVYYMHVNPLHTQVCECVLRDHLWRGKWVSTGKIKWYLFTYLD